MTTKRFGQLPVLATLANDDIFAVTDTDATQSKQVTGLVLRDYILSDSNIELKTGTIVTKINALNPTVGNNLYASRLFVSNSLGYKPASYFLEWNNISGKPSIPTDLTDLENSGNFVSYDTTTGSGRMRVSGVGATNQNMTSDYIEEGTENLFYTNTRVDDRVELNFGALFNVYSSTFDGGNVTESLQDIPGTFRNVDENQSNTVRVSDSSVADNFSVGQTLRIYGASRTAEDEITTTPTLAAPAVTGFTENVAGTEFSYKAAKFNLATGEVSEVTAARTVNVYNGGSDVLSAFNSTHFIRLTFGGYSASQGIVLYRRVGGVGDYKLIAVLGPKDLQTAPYKDYYTFDYTSWSGKSETDNSYTSITHFPLTANSTRLRGWADVTITSINKQNGFFDLSFGSTFVYVNSSPTVQIAHNDTTKINEAILTKSAQGRKSITLNAKTYNAAHIDLPDNFGILGTANITKVKKLPWSGYKGNTPNNNLITSVATTAPESISFVGIDFDGNVGSQYLLIDDANDAINYLMDFKTASKSILFETCRIRNVIGGGVYASSPTEFKMATSEITNSGVTDRHTFSPMIIDNGTTSIITGNRFENFSDAINASVSNEAIFTNNLVKACGSGLFVYGSTFMLSSPNVLIGAANEFLSSPDILNSQFDSINIFRDELPISGPYSSDQFTYQENGEAYDLSYSSTNIPPVIRYRANLVKKLSSGQEELYGNTVGPSAVGINGVALSSGASPFGMISGKKYVIMEAGNVNWEGIGAPNNSVGTSFTYDGSTVEQAGGSAATTGLAKSPEFVGFGDVSVNTPIVFQNDTTSVNPAAGGWQFQISDAEVSRIKSGTYGPSNLQTLYDAEVAAGRQPAGSSHVGVAWSASQVYYAKAGDITGVTTGWDTTSLGEDPTYIVRVNLATLRVPLVERTASAQGSIVRFQGHTGFTLYTGSGSQNYGEIITIAQVGADPESTVKDLYIKFHKGGDPGATGVDPNSYGLSNGAAEGTINILDDFVMAQGLIK